jgi:peptidoglycan/LPS O-acetylase OafA/YrhL
MSSLNAEQKNLFRYPALDGFRGIGCLLVMLGHTQWTDKKTILPGALTAMDLFFVLSGFLITGLLIAEHERTKTIDFLNFWKRRAMRLLPVFYVYYSVGALVYLFSRFQPIVGSDAMVTLLTTAFYTSNWALASGYEMGIYAVTWSLSLEEQFYLLCPVLFLFLFKYFSKKNIMWVLGIGIIAVNLHRYMLFHQFLENQGLALAFKRSFYGLDTRSDSLMIGCLASLVYHVYGHRFHIGFKLASVALVLFFASVLVRDVPIAFHEARNSFYTEFLMSGGFTLISLFGVLIILHLVQNPTSAITKIFSMGILNRIGLMSYSIYIWHTTVFGGLEVALNSFNRSPLLWLAKTLIRFTAAFAVGYASFKFIELPILKYQYKKRKFTPLSIVEQAQLPKEITV